MCGVGEVSLTLTVRNTWFLSLIWAGQGFSLLLLFGSFCPWEETPAAWPGARLSPLQCHS